ncbi:g4929 [Coccomyxa elongata]
MAAQQWLRVCNEAENLERHNITPIGSTRQEHPMEEAARSASSISAQRQTPVLKDDEIKELLMTRKNLDPAHLERPACSDFVAASKGFSERQARLHMQGIAAVVCRHEFVLVAVNLFTHENFVYHELLLDKLLRLYDETKGKKLHCFFLDIACQFQACWNRMRPEWAEVSPIMAFGEWHLKAHIPSCQKAFTARLMEGTGTALGDNVEHVWGDLRKHGHLTKRMIKGSRQDKLTLLVVERQRQKERRLAQQLLSWACRAVRRAIDLDSSLASLQQEIQRIVDQDNRISVTIVVSHKAAFQGLPV